MLEERVTPIDGEGRRGEATAMSFHFGLVECGRLISEIGHPVDDHAQALAVAKRLAIDLAGNRQQCLGNGYATAMIEDDGREIHRESIDGAEKSG